VNQNIIGFFETRETYANDVSSFNPYNVSTETNRNLSKVSYSCLNPGQWIFHKSERRF